MADFEVREVFTAAKLGMRLGWNEARGCAIVEEAPAARRHLRRLRLASINGGAVARITTEAAWAKMIISLKERPVTLGFEPVEFSAEALRRAIAAEAAEGDGADALGKVAARLGVELEAVRPYATKVAETIGWLRGEEVRLGSPRSVASSPRSHVLLGYDSDDSAALDASFAEELAALADAGRDVAASGDRFAKTSLLVDAGSEAFRRRCAALHARYVGRQFVDYLAAGGGQDLARVASVEFDADAASPAFVLSARLADTGASRCYHICKAVDDMIDDFRCLETRPAGTDVNKGPPERCGCSLRTMGAAMKSCTSPASANCRSFVSSLVLTMTVRERSGSAFCTISLVAPCFQSMVSSTQRMM